MRQILQALNILRVLVSILVKINDMYTEVTLNVAFFPEKERKKKKKDTGLILGTTGQTVDLYYSVKVRQ